ncbi:MAG: DinB family protein [Gemmatimonadaceae bacterium]
MSLLPRMFAHMAWADDRALQSLREMADPPTQALNLLSHMLGAEHEWLSRIHGEKSTHAIWPKLNLVHCAALARENHAAYAQLAREAAEGDGGRMIAYRTSKGAEHTNTLEDILLHVAQHGTYHRGQVALLVRASGGNAIPTDYILFSRDKTT